MNLAVLIAAVFLAGFIMMVLEVVGARFLTKDFGSAFHVWVSQIGVVLIALAAGYWWGGWLADRSGRLKWAGGALWVGGLWTLAIPWFANPLIRALIRRHPADEPIPAVWQRLDPVLGSALVFLVPCLALAMLSPCMIRLATVSLAHVGRSSGTLIGGGTLGSILGVFTAGYVLIEHLRMTRIFQVMGGLTLLLAALCVWLDRRRFAGRPSPDQAAEKATGDDRHPATAPAAGSDSAHNGPGTRGAEDPARRTA